MVYESGYSPVVSNSPHSLAPRGTVETGPQLDTPVIAFNRAFMVRGFQGVMSNGVGGLGEFNVSSFLSGSTLPLVLGGGMLLYMMFFGKAASERSRQLKAAKQEYQSKVQSIKGKYRRLPKISYSEG